MYVKMYLPVTKSENAGLLLITPEAVVEGVIGLIVESILHNVSNDYINRQNLSIKQSINLGISMAESLFSSFSAADAAAVASAAFYKIIES